MAAPDIADSDTSPSSEGRPAGGAAPPAPALLKQPLLDLYNDFAAVREEVLESGISDEELHALIDEAIAESRRSRPAPVAP
ncbi:MAG: hypothetical protein QM692_18450 [Thermomicrobiales bacterium]